jgi:Calcineurin-like phosphoesterase
MKNALFRTILGTALGALSLAACSSGADGTPAGDQADEAVGSVELLLSSVPSDAACLQVTVSGSRSVSKSFDLTAGSSPKLVLSGLPVGAVKVDGSAFSAKCSKVKSSSVPNWVLEKPVTTRIDDLDVAKILLKLIRNGRGEVAVDFEAPPWLSTSKAPIDLAIIGDTPYGAAQIEDFPNLLSAIDADERVSTVVHLGDIKNGSSRCDDAYFAQIFAGFSTLTIPLVYTPGDNEWTDCHRANNGAYDPLERLDVLRQIFFPVPGLALGGGFKQVLTQADDAGFGKYVENQLWVEAGVAFAALHAVGSNDSKVAWYTDDTTGTKVDDPARRDAERTARNAANLAWTDRLFDVAAEQGAAGVVLMMQADMFDAFSVANNLPLDSFDNIVQKIATRAKAFGKPVLLLQGDSHAFIADKPLENGNPLHGVTTPVANLTRIVVQGSTTKPLTEWLRLHVDASTPAVFTWERNAR